MFTGSWDDLIGTVLEERYRLETLVASGHGQAEFRAQPVTPEDTPPCLVTLISVEPDEVAEQLAAIERAKALQHPNLLRILDGGKCSSGTAGMLYVATESAEGTLAQTMAAGPLPETAVKGLAGDLVSALEYIHGQGLVCRTVEPDAIVRAGDRWKLGDLGQLHPAGDFGPSASQAGSPRVPPEAAEGRIRPEGDIWALGVTLRDALAGQRRNGPRTTFDTVVKGCLEPDPARRLPLEEIRRLLERETAPVAAAPGPEPRVKPAEPARRRFRSAVLVGACAAVVLAVAGGVVFRREAPAPAPASAPPAEPVQEQTAAPPSGRPSAFTGKTVLSPGTQPSTSTPEPAAKQEVPPPSATAPAATPAPDTGRAAQSEPAVEGGGELTGRANFFGDDLNGQVTASGERFSNDAMTAAHRSLPFGTRLRVTNLGNRRSVVVRVNDRASGGRGLILRVTRAAARELGFERTGSAKVGIEVIR